MREQHCIDIVVASVPGKPGFRRHQLLRDAWPQYDRARQVFAFHDFLDRQRSRDVHGLAGIVAFAVSGGAFDHRLAIGDAGHLRRLGNAVDIRAECNDRFAAAPGRPPGAGNPGYAGFNRKAVFLKNLCQVALCFKFLEAQFGKGEQAVDDFLG